MCIRITIDLPSRTVTAYYGDDFETMSPWTPDTVTFGIAYNGAVSDFGKLTFGGKGAVSFDDIAVRYTPVPFAIDTFILGNPNADEVMKGSYLTYSASDGAAEGDTYCWWESSSNENFTSDVVRLTTDAPIKQGGWNEYTTTSYDKGRYIRFCVVPVNEFGVKGSVSYSDPTLPVDSLTVTSKIDGKIKNGNWDGESYKGYANIKNTTSEFYDIVLIMAVYQDGVLENTYTEAQRIYPGKGEETGLAEADMYTDTVTIAKEDRTGKGIKVFLWDSYNKLSPLTPVSTLGTFEPVTQDAPVEE